MGLTAIHRGGQATSPSKGENDTEETLAWEAASVEHRGPIPALRAHGITPTPAESSWLVFCRDLRAPLDCERRV